MCVSNFTLSAWRILHFLLWRGNALQFWKSSCICEALVPVSTISLRRFPGTWTLYGSIDQRASYLIGRRLWTMEGATERSKQVALQKYPKEIQYPKGIRSDNHVHDQNDQQYLHCFPLMTVFCLDSTLKLDLLGVILRWLLSVPQLSLGEGLLFCRTLLKKYTTNVFSCIIRTEVFVVVFPSHRFYSHGCVFALTK